MKRKYLIYLVTLLLFVHCSTKKNTWVSRSYHNLTAKYNVLFNGLQSFEEGRQQMRQSLNNDFFDLLPMFAYCNQAQGQVPLSQMNRAIRKGQKLIEKHSITAKPGKKPTSANIEYRDFYDQNEFNRWVDDAWMLIGKAHIYSQKWYEAISAFDMVLQVFPGQKVRLEAFLWMARAYIELEDFENADRLLKLYQSEAGGEKRYFVLEQSTLTWFWLAQGNYINALEYCRQAAGNTHDRWEKVRWNFVLGQIAQKLGKRNIALQAFDRVIQLKPDYETTIHARIQQALLEGAPDHPEMSRDILEKYAAEYKNQFFRGQIYYAIADTWFREGDTIMALANLQLAAGYAAENPVLRGMVFKQLADVSFELGNYISADAYYDSTLTSLPEDYQGIAEIEQIKRKLSPLAENLNVIEYEDSLLRIASMPENERDLFIEQLLEQRQEQAASDQFVDNSDDAFFYRNFGNISSGMSSESGEWYFYNQMMVSLGKMEFEKRWGRLKLEDNWRRSNKKMQMQQAEDNPVMPDDPFAQNPASAQPNAEKPAELFQSEMVDRESLLAGLPLDSEQKEEAHRRIEKALFNAGNILANNFNKYSEAVSLFEQLLAQYPESPYVEQTLMGIYLACRELNDTECMGHYSNVITQNYPQSRFAKIVSNTDFLENIDALETEMEQTYNRAYLYLKRGSWQSVVQATKPIMIQNYEPLMPQAYLLNALAYTQMDEDKLTTSQLQQVVDNFPQSQQAEVADYWLQKLKSGEKPGKIDFGAYFDVPDSTKFTEGQVSTEKLLVANKFLTATDSVHHLIVVVDQNTDVNELIFQLANFNFDHYATGRLQLEISQSVSERTVLMTGPFKDQRTALDYLFSLINQPSVFCVENANEPLVMVVADTNWKQIHNSGDLDDYVKFFLEEYLPGSDRSSIVINDSEIPKYPYTERAKNE
ncbi:type IX secretion system periplasmic lipoprotein PorW/SprE [Thermophagus sp. OGC60D27]|uniref:type IX secretion system periplasmic lipoprotein PorW/SprE n=1 Tax=Thermophagus sp. OGC60D27 TaxID=3458415 RepID=UPI004037CE8C